MVGRDRELDGPNREFPVLVRQKMEYLQDDSQVDNVRYEALEMIVADKDSIFSQ
jgi:hypothetical protein